MGRVGRSRKTHGSGRWLEVFDISRVGSGRAYPTRLDPIRPDPTRLNPTRPMPQAFIWVAPRLLCFPSRVIRRCHPCARNSVRTWCLKLGPPHERFLVGCGTGSPFLHAIRRTLHSFRGALRSVQPMPRLVGDNQPDVAPFRHRRDARVCCHTTTAIDGSEYTPPSPFLESLAEVPGDVAR